MTGAAFSHDVVGMAGLGKLLSRLADPDLRDLMAGLAAEGETQTRRRIEEEMASPEGQAWAPLSERYARRKAAGITVAGVKLESDGGLLQFQGHLLDSITSAVVGNDEAEWGSNLVYAATHQFGDEGRNIPARPYLGLSDDNADDLVALATDFVREVIHGAH